MTRRWHGVARGCLVVVVVLVVLVAGLAWSLKVVLDRFDREAATDLREKADGSRARLLASAEDGSLLGTEVSRTFRYDKAVVRGGGSQFTVLVELVGEAPGLLAGTRERGCYRFTVEVPRVHTQRLAAASCVGHWNTWPREPEMVAKDISTELRSALADGGLEAARDAVVWDTPAVSVTHQALSDDVLTTMVHLYQTSDEEVCYVFRSAAENRAVSYTKRGRWDCYPSLKRPSEG